MLARGIHAGAEAAAKAPPPESATKAAPVATVSGLAKSSDVAAQKREEKTEQKKEQANEPQAAADEPRKVATLPDNGRDAQLRITPSARRAASVGGAANSRNDESDRNRKKKDESEVRSVSGHKFRKEDGVWVDSSYSSQGTVNVSRGSEQYRALIADEPGIKTIAEQLDGEIVLVWKGRAYRIK